MVKVILTVSRTHQKHAFIEKPYGGKYHRNEWTIIGAPCSVIKKLVEDLSRLLKAEGLKSGYLDMQHKEEDMDSAADTILIDKLNHIQWTANKKIYERNYKKYFDDLDLLFVNGNHFKGQKQIVIIDERKRDSLNRKLDRLNDIKLIVKHDAQVYNFLEGKYDKSAVILDLKDIESIADHIASTFKKDIPTVYGLVLAGGKSSRMGEDKASINYHGKNQSTYEADLLNIFCDKTFISKSSEEDTLSYPVLKDSFLDLGPYGGILSAFRHSPNVAWLTLACDLPYLDKETVQQLFDSRNPHKLATCFYNPETKFPEPLITIWEPRAYPILLDFLSQGYSCPRKVLINSDIEMIEMKDPVRMKNSNTPEEKKEAMAFISNHDKS